MLSKYLPLDTSKAFAQKNVITVQQLACYKGESPVDTMPVTLSFIKHYVTSQSFSPICTTSEHSWFNKICHVQNSQGKMVRGIIGNLLINFYDISFEVTYYRQSSKKRQALPLELLMNHYLWCDVEFLSDDDCDSDENQSVYDAAPSLFGRFQVMVTPEILQLGDIHGLRLQKLISKVNAMYTRLENRLESNLILQ
jgi:hypothetical protein